MQRCIDLARHGAGYVAPNPMVGAVLVHNDKIIGEGWHRQYGQAHAEVNCIDSVKDEDKTLVSQATLYVSLEPCAHFGKTPPCADLVIQYQIPAVVIGCRDPFKEVDGKGIERLKAAGVTVELAPADMEEKCRDLNKRFFTFHTQKRPYIILKWAETGDGKMAAPLNPPQGGTLDSETRKDSNNFEDSKTLNIGELGEASRLIISNEYSNRLVHQWRSEEAAIMVGTNTALMDDPALTTRLWPGPSPIRLVVDMDLKLPTSLKIFNQEVPTIIFNTIRSGETGNLSYYKVTNDSRPVQQLLHALYQMDIQSVLVEGGAKLLQSFIEESIWDEVRIIKNEELMLSQKQNDNGLNAPVLKTAIKVLDQKFLSDNIEIYKPCQTSDSRSAVGKPLAADGLPTPDS